MTRVPGFLEQTCQAFGCRQKVNGHDLCAEHFQMAHRVPGLGGLWWLGSRTHDIAEARLKGTSRPWQQPADLDPSQRAERDAQARLERAERDVGAIGEHPAPLHLDVLDLLVDLLATADHLAERIAQAAGVERMPPAASAMADPEPYLRYAAAHLAAAIESDELLGVVVEHEASRLRYDVAKHLGEFVYGQRLACLCPFCDGGIEKRQTLRVREVRGIPSVVCESGTCEPSEAECGTWLGSKPAWPLDTEAAWLAQRIEHAQEQRQRGAA